MIAKVSPRRALSRDAVIVEAIALADSEGLETVSMRSLATRLGVVPMALYRHVADKEDLLSHMVDRIIAGYEQPPATREWSARVRGRILSARDATVAHPWLGDAINSRKRRTETVLAHMNTVAGDFLAGGVSPDLTHYAMHALGNRIWGLSDEAFDDPDAPSSTDADSPDLRRYMSERYPHVIAVALDAMQRNPSGACERDTEFAFTLDLLLDAIRRLHRAGWESRPGPPDRSP